MFRVYSFKMKTFYYDLQESLHRVERKTAYFLKLQPLKHPSPKVGRKNCHCVAPAKRKKGSSKSLRVSLSLLSPK